MLWNVNAFYFHSNEERVSLTILIGQLCKIKRDDTYLLFLFFYFTFYVEFRAHLSCIIRAST